MALLTQSRESAGHMVGIGDTRVVARMARITRRRGPRKARRMTGIARHALMRARQRKARLAMRP